MSTAGKVEAFNSKFKWNQTFDISKSELQKFCALPIEHLTLDTISDVVLNLSYLALTDHGIGELSLRTIDRVIKKDDAFKSEIVDRLIDNLQPLLLRTGTSRDVKRPGLRPSVGLSFQADESRRKWKQNGGMKSIPLFYVILLHLGHNKLSSNLWWITPGILNLLDDSTDLDGIKLRGVLLLRTFLENSFKDDSRWVAFQDTGLFELYEPILTNMCYYLPPVHTAEESIKVWKQVFPTLDSLYSLQFKEDSSSYKKYQGNFMSELILQQVIPRINMTSETLAVFVLETLNDRMQRLGGSTLYYLSRIIYTLGEYVIRDPFLTIFEVILGKTIDCLKVLITVCPSDRVVAHKFDFLALSVIMFDKCKQEGKLSSELNCKLRALVHSLEEKGCDFTDEKLELTKIRDVGQLFSQN